MNLFARTFLLAAFSLSAAADCEKELVTTADMMGCANSEYAKADKALNSAYAGLMKEWKGQRHGGQDPRQAIRVAQRHWIKQRDLDCKASYEADSSYPGTIAALGHVGCLEEKTKQRTAFLKSLLPL